jgi:PhnB protein
LWIWEILAAILESSGNIQHLYATASICTSFLIQPACKLGMATRAKRKSKVKAKTKVGPIPKRYHTVTPTLVVRNAPETIEFYKKAFGAKEKYRMYMPDGKTIMHAEIKIGDSSIMLADENPQWKTLSPQSIGGTGVTLYTYVKNVDKVFEQAVAAGAIVTMPVMDAFWGDRNGQLMDPSGHLWSIATHKRDMSAKEMQKAQEEWLAQQQQQ